MSRSTNEAILNTLALLLGGMGGALAGGLLIRLGVKPVIARAGVAVAGGTGAVLVPGMLGCAFGGAAAAGVSQLALGFLEAERREIEDQRSESTDGGGAPIHGPYLQALAETRAPDARLLGKHSRDWPRKWVQRICKLAEVPEVTAHGMRGLHSTLAVDAGISGHAVASALGHESFKTTVQSYAKPEALTRAKQHRVLKVLAGGRR